MAIRRLQLNEFRKQAAAGGNVGRCIVPKGFTCAVAKAAEDLAGERRLQFTISTGEVDRDNDIVNPKGAVNLDTFPSTGVVLWAHDARLPPIAKPIKAWIDGDSIKAVAEFQPPDMDHPLGRGFGATVQRYYEEGFMKSVSIGFMPAEWRFAEDRELGINFDKWELLEFSPVPIPANRAAVVDLAAKGIDMRGVYDWATRCLDGDVELLVPRRLVEDAREGLREIYAAKSIVDLGAHVKAPIAWASAHPDGTPAAPKDAQWDGAAEVAAADVAALEVMCAWRAEADEPTKGDFKFPHHLAEGDHAVVYTALAAGVAVLNGGRGGADIPDEDRDGVYAHLARHYRDDFEEEPPELRGMGEDDEEDDDDEEDEAAKAASVAKFGRVLSAKNEADLRQARDLIDAVLEQVEAQQDDDKAEADHSAAEGSAKSEATTREPVLTVPTSPIPSAAEQSASASPSEIELTPEDVAGLVNEAVRLETEKFWKRISGELP